MKKFFKALALVLALTLVIGTIPASAATEFKFRNGKNTKVLYLDGAKGTRKDADGNVIACKTKDSYVLSAFIDNFDKNSMKTVLESKDPNVAAIEEGHPHTLVAKGIGTTTVTIKILDKASDTDIWTQDITVYVKKNASLAAFGYIVTDAEGNVITDPNYKFATGTDYIVTLTRKDAEGNYVDTDKRSLTCDSDKVTIKAGEKGIMYRVNFSEAGEYTFLASAFQSAKYSEPTVGPIPVTLKVGYEAVAVDQYSLNQAVVTFETNVANPNKDLFKLYTKVTNNGEEKLLDDIQVKEVKVADDDKTKVIVTFETNFVGGKEYFVYYADKEVGPIVAASVNADSVARVEVVPGQEFEVNKTGTLAYKLYNDKDVDITAAYGTALNGTISAELVDKSDTTSNIWGLDVVLGKENTSYDVKLTYSWYDSTGLPQSKEANGVIRCIPVKVYERADFKGVITTSDKGITKDNDTAINGECTETLYALGDGQVAIKVAIGYKLNGNMKYDVIDGTVTNNTGVYDDYKLVSASEKVAMVVTGNQLEGISAGSTNIVVYGQKAGQADQVVGVIPVTINPGRALASFVVTPSKLALNMAYAEDAITFDLIAKDQYGAEMKKDVTITQIKANAYTGPVATIDGTKATAKPGNNAEITLTPAKLSPIFKEDGVTPNTTTLIFEFDCEGKKYRVSNLDCGYAATADRQLLNITGESELKTGVTKTSGSKTTTIGLKGLANNKYAVSGAAVSFYSGTGTPAIDRANASHRYVYTVKKDGTLIGRNDNFVGNTFTNVVKGGNTVSGSAIKLAAGTYTVDLYEFKTSSDGKFATPYMIDSASFKVTDDQTGLNCQKLKIEGIGQDLVEGFDFASAKCFKFTFGNDDVTSDVEIIATFAGDKSSAYVKKAIYKAYNSDLGEFTVEVAIDTVVRK